MTGWEPTNPPPFATCDNCDQWADGLLDGRPLCADCCDRLLDRTEALAINPAMQDTLPGLDEWTP